MLHNRQQHSVRRHRAARRLKSVAHALEVLSLFSPARPRWSVTEISERLSLGKSTVSRLLSTMAESGFVSKDAETGRYDVGFRVYEIGGAYLSSLSLRRVAMPVLEEVAFALHETVYLGILGDGVAVYIDKLLSPLSLRVDSHLGVAIPLHATALGKVLLAGLPAADVDTLIARGLRPYTRRTITDPRALRAELAAVRRQDFATDLEEFEDNLHCIGFPLRDYRGTVAAAFSIAGPAVRLTREVMTQHLPLLRQAAAAISQRLGYAAAPAAGDRPEATVDTRVSRGRRSSARPRADPGRAT
jgi:IclR family KDG regulon transcriptional repressor